MLDLTGTAATTAACGPAGQLPSTPFLSNTRTPTIGAELTS